MQIVRLARRGLSLRAVARRLGISLRTVQPLGSNAPKGNGSTVSIGRTDPKPHDAIAGFPRKWKTWFWTCAAPCKPAIWGRSARWPSIRNSWNDTRLSWSPSVRTIGRILERRGVLDGRRRTRRPPPPTGWYLPDVVGRFAEVDAFDVVEGLVLKGGLDVQVLNGISLHGSLLASWPRQTIRATNTLEFILGHWRAFGLPTYAQFDNDTRFQGPHLYPNSLGRIIRLCLSLQVVPVFVPPRETGFQASIESFNGRWQAKVWARFQHASLHALQERSDRYIAAARQRHAPRTETAPFRRPIAADWTLDLQSHPQGRLVFLRRTNDKGTLELLGHSWMANAHWARRLVRAEVDFTTAKIRIYALRRSQPKEQPLLSEHNYLFPKGKFRDKPWRPFE